MAMDEDEESRQFLTDVASFNEGLFIRRIFILSDSPRLWPKKDINLQIHIDGHDGSSFRVQTDAGTDVASDGYLIDPRDVQSVAMNDQLWKVLGLDHGVFEEPIDQRAVIGDGRSAGQRDVLAVVDEHLDVIDALRHRAGPGTTGSTGKGVASVNEEATGGAR